MIAHLPGFPPLGHIIEFPLDSFPITNLKKLVEIGHYGLFTLSFGGLADRNHWNKWSPDIFIGHLCTSEQFHTFTGVFFLNFQHPKGHQPFLETKMLFGNTSFHDVPVGGLDHIIFFPPLGSLLL